MPGAIWRRSLPRWATRWPTSVRKVARAGAPVQNDRTASICSKEHQGSGAPTGSLFDSPTFRLRSGQALSRKNIGRGDTRKKMTRANIGSLLKPLLLAAISIAIGAGCRGGPPPLNLPPDAKVLRLADSDDVPSLDPAAGYDTVSWT